MSAPPRSFDEAMMDIYRRARAEANYTATIFFQMISDRGGLATARTLVNAPRPSDGYTALYERGRLDLTVEALIVDNPEWHPLFSEDELKKAARRLREYGYRSGKP